MEIVIDHAAAPGYAVSLSTGVSLSILPDEMVQLVFFHDAARIRSETFVSSQEIADADPGQTAIELAPAVDSMKLDRVRLDQAAIVMPIQRFKMLAEAIAKMVEHPAIKG